MLPSGQGLQGQSHGLTSMEDYLRKKEELRRIKAAIEAAEQSIDFQLAGQMQPSASAAPQHHVANLNATHSYPSRSLPATALTFAAPFASPVVQETASIVEVDNMSSPPSNTSNALESKLVSSPSNQKTPESLALQQQGYMQTGFTDTPRTGPSNSYQLQLRPSTYNYHQYPQKHLNQTNNAPVQSSSMLNNQSPVNVSSQADSGPVHMAQSVQDLANNVRSKVPDSLFAYNQSSHSRQAFQSSSSVSVMQSVIQDQMVRQPENELQALRGQLIQDTDMQMQDGIQYNPGTSVELVPQQDLSGVPKVYEKVASTGTNASTDGGPVPISRTIFNDDALRLSTHRDTTPLDSHPNTHHDASVQPISPSKAAPAVPTLSSLTGVNDVSPSNASDGQGDASLNGNSQLPALSKLEEILADHERWSEQATSRILKQAMEAPTPRPSQRDTATDEDRLFAQKNEHAPSAPVVSEQSQSHSASASSANNPPPHVSEPHDATTDASVPVDQAIIKAHERNLSPLHKFLPESLRLSNTTNPPVVTATPVNQASLAVAAGASLPHTPITNNKLGTSTPLSASADRNTLAKDIIRALLPPSSKRKRDTFEAHDGNDISVDSPLAKRNKLSGSNTPEQTTNSEAPPLQQSVNSVKSSTDSRPAHPVSRPPQAPQLQQAALQQQLSWRVIQGMQQSSATHATRTQPYPAGYMLQSQYVPHPYYATPPSWWSIPQAPRPTTGSSTGPLPMGPRQPIPIGAHTASLPSSTQQPPKPSRQPSKSNQQPSMPNQQPSKPNQQPSKPNQQPSKSNQIPSKPNQQPSKPSYPSGILQQPPTSTPKAVSLSPNVSPSKPPLFLPSPDSPPLSSQNATPPAKSYSLPVVELLTSRRKSKPAAKTAKTTKESAFDVHTNLSAASLSSASASGQLFGRPTGALAAASHERRVGVRPLKSKPYVLVPQVDTSLWYAQAGSLKGKQKDDFRPYQTEAEVIDYNDEEVDHVKEFTRRLIRRPCLWKNCQAVLDSGEKLLKHVKILHGKETVNNLHACQWRDCQSTRGFTDSERLIRHVQWHVNSRIFCGYEQCSFRTQLPVQLMEHVAESHNDEDRLRPYAVPVDLAQPNVPDVVNILPTYMSIPIPVCARPISQDRHQRIGPWVLQRIFGKVAIKKGAVSAAVPLRSQRLLEKQAQSTPTYDTYEQVQKQFKPQDDYEFLKREGVTKSFAPLVPLPLLIDDIEVTEATGVEINNGDLPRTGTPGSTTARDDTGLGPTSSAFESGLNLPLAEADASEPNSVVLGNVQEADEVEELL